MLGAKQGSGVGGRDSMAFPTFTAEVTLYKSTRLYRGYSARTGLNAASNAVVPADCDTACKATYWTCVGACLLAGPGIFPLFGTVICRNACDTARETCLSLCHGGGGSGAPPPPRRCSSRQKCCGTL